MSTTRLFNSSAHKALLYSLTTFRYDYNRLQKNAAKIASYCKKHINPRTLPKAVNTHLK